MELPARILQSRIRLPRILLAGTACLVLLAGCGDDPAPPASEDDPALSGALGDQIMVDPDLAGQNKGIDAVSAGDARVELPPEARSPEAIAAARKDALMLAGGKLTPAPAAEGGTDVPSMVDAAATAARVAEEAKLTSKDCSAQVEYAMNWANSVPEALRVYPRGAVQEAAGTDAGGCKLRIVNFVTPVATKDVMDFYYTRVRAAGYDARHRMDGKDNVLGGSRIGAAYVIYARSLGNGLTEVDLVVSGG